MVLDPFAFGIALLAVGALGALVMGVSSVARRGDALARRLAAPDMEMGAPIPSALAVRKARGSLLARLVGPIARIAMPMRKDELDRLRSRMQQAGLRSEHSLPLFVSGKVILAVAFVGAFLWINSRRTEPFEPGFLIAIVTFAAGYYLPEAWLVSRARKRQTAIERGLPDALDLLVTCVEAGLGLDASLQRVADEVRLAWPVLAGEMQTTFLEVKAGIPRVESFRRLAARTGVRDLKSLSATLTQTEIFGTSVALALRVQAEGIRVRRMQRAEEKAAYISVKMTIPLVLCILPSLLAIVIGPAIVGIATNLLPALGGK